MAIPPNTIYNRYRVSCGNKCQFPAASYTARKDSERNISIMAYTAMTQTQKPPITCVNPCIILVFIFLSSPFLKTFICNYLNFTTFCFFFQVSMLHKSFTSPRCAILFFFTFQPICSLINLLLHPFLLDLTVLQIM